MIYYFTGPNTDKKDELVSMMYELLATHKKNWRQRVFLVDATTDNESDIYSILSFLNQNECDVVVNLEHQMGTHPNWIIYIDVPTERKSVKTMFSNIVTQLRVKNQI